tara:strand:- start:5750 stop:6370 length:621 start_codon:yes stop_codon:yes gene_type:complete
MIYENKYWYFDRVLPEIFCDHIIERGNKETEIMASTGGFDIEKDFSKENLEKLKTKRNSNIVWLNDRWIYDEIHPFVNSANHQAGWKFDWDWTESCQFTKYKLNQHYGWHVDGWDKPYADKTDGANGKIRKLSTVCILSDSSDYEGGEFEFQFRNQDDPTVTWKVEELKNRGSLIVFPSHLWHRVRPVTSGTRYSLVTWHLGLPFK